MSSAEAFVRVQRLLAAKNVVLVFCGFTTESAIGKALQSVGVLGEDRVELFMTFNDAMECELFVYPGHTKHILIICAQNRDRECIFASLV